MAYKQNFGRNNLTNANISALTNGGTDPETDPKPNGVVASNSDKTFGSGVINELDTVTLGTVKNNEPVVMGPSNRAESATRRRQIKRGKAQGGEKNYLDSSYDQDQNITRTTSTVDKVGADGQPYSMTRNNFIHPLGGTATNVDTTPSAAFIGENSAGLFFDSNAARTQAQNSSNYMNSPQGQKRRGSEMQNFGTEVTGGRDSGRPLEKYMVNNQTGDIVGQLSGEGTTKYLFQGQNQLPSNRIGEFKNHNGYAQLLDGNKMSNQTLLNLTPEKAMAYIRQDSLDKQRNRFTNKANDKAVNYRNSMFKKPDLTSGKDN